MFYLIAILLVLVLISLNKIYAAVEGFEEDSEKLSPFECGILEIGDARQRFDISFYIIAILFLIFDLEVILVFPYASIFYLLGYYGYIGFIVLLIILSIGLVYELRSLKFVS